jgi:hypothetical protein
MIRHYVNTVSEAISYLIRYDTWSPYSKVLNDFYHVLSLKLERVRLAGNYFAHLHDATEFNTLPPYGVRWKLFSQVFDHVSGLPYGGRNGQPTRYLPSLRRELEDYVAILRPFYERARGLVSASPADATEAPQIFNAVFNGQPVKFAERKIAADGNCGFTGLKLTRTDSIKKLIRQLDVDPNIAAMVRDDVREAFRGRELPPTLMARVHHSVTQLQGQEDIMDGILSTLNDQYEARQIASGLAPRRLTVPEMIAELESIRDDEALEKMGLLINAKEKLDTIQEEIWAQLDAPVALAEFLREEFLNGGKYLSYVRGNRGTLYAIAYMNNFEVHIWTRDAATGDLVESFAVPAHGAVPPKDSIHLYNTNYGATLNHFNLLTIFPEKSPVKSLF